MNILEIYKKKAIIKTINSIKISKICNKFAILKNNEKEAQILRKNIEQYTHNKNPLIKN